MKNDFFQFRWFNELQIGDVFKFCRVIDSEFPNIFFTVINKNEYKTKINSTYGKELHVMELPNKTHNEVMIFPNKKRQINL